jgi:hypothetical protein
MTAALTEPSTDAAPARRGATRAGTVPTIISIVVFGALSTAASIASEGFLEADGCTHYLYARFAVREPHFLVNVWGRPLFTALYALPASFGGLVGTHLLSLAIAIGCALVAHAIARGQRYRWPALALIFTLAQPLVFLHSFSELTELPFALLLGCAFLAYQRRRWLVLAILAGMGPLARPEGFGFLALTGVALVAHRRWWWLLVLPIPLVLWNHAGWVISGSRGPWWNWLPSNWPYSQQSLYARGSVLHFVALLPAVTSPLVFPTAIFGIWRALFDRADERHRQLCQRLIALVPLSILVGHSILYATGRLASSGELRYMLVAAPFWGLLSARGWEWIFARVRWRGTVTWAGLAALAGGFANVVFPIVPLLPNPNEDYAKARRFVDWYRRSELDRRYPRVCAAQVFIYYFLDVSPTDPQRGLEYLRGKLDPPPPGTILVWDPVYSLYNSDERRSIPAEELLKSGWVETARGSPFVADGWRVFVSEPASAPRESDGQQVPPR